MTETMYRVYAFSPDRRLIRGSHTLLLSSAITTAKRCMQFKDTLRKEWLYSRAEVWMGSDEVMYSATRTAGSRGRDIEEWEEGEG